MELVGSEKDIQKAFLFIQAKNIQIEEVVARESEHTNYYQRGSRYAVHG